MAKNWTKEEDIFLKTTEKSISEQATILGRTLNSIHKRRQSIGIGKSRLPTAIGETHGRLTVIGFCERKLASASTRVVCKCTCGSISEKTLSRIRNGDVVSCGCYLKEMRGKFGLKTEGEAPLNMFEGDYRKSARARGISWNLTKEQFRKIILEDCFWCGKKPSKWNPYIDAKGKPKDKAKMEFTWERSWVYINGVDRADNEKGYSPENAVPCCTECNRSKMDRTAKSFFEHCQRVAYHIASKINPT